MNLCLVSMYTKEVKELAVITVEYNKRKYCEKHGYDLEIKTKPDSFETKKDFGIAHFGYEKIGAILKIFEEKDYDWIYWCGSDTMITNYNIKLEDLIDDNYHFIIANDLWGINADSILVKNSSESKEFLREVYNTFFQYVNKDGTNIDTGQRLPDGGARSWAEQGAIMDLKDKYQSIIKEVPQKTMNSYMYHLYPSPWHQKGLDCNGNSGTWSQGDFLLHLPGMSNQMRINIVINLLNEVIGDD